MAELRTTELEAVNTMLACVGSAPVNLITGDLTADVQIAVDLLRNTSRGIQTEGWNFNTEEDWSLSLDGNSKVPLPGNCMDVDLTTEDGTLEVTQRGDFLYDKKNHTFVFTTSPKCTLILFLPWTDLNEPARNFIKVKAARIYQDQTLGSQEHHMYTQRDEDTAQLTFMSSDARNEDATIFDTPDMAGIINRRRPRVSTFPN